MLIGTRIEAFDAGMAAADELDVQDGALPDDLDVFAYRKASELLVSVRLLEAFKSGLRSRLAEREIEHICGDVEKLHPASPLRVEHLMLIADRESVWHELSELDSQDRQDRGRALWPPPHARVDGGMTMFRCSCRVWPRFPIDIDDPPKKIHFRRYRCEIDEWRVRAKDLEDAGRFAIERARMAAKNENAPDGTVLQVAVKADYAFGPSDTFVAVV